MMVLLAVAALVFFGWTVYSALKMAVVAYQESTSSLRFEDAPLLDLVAEKRVALAAIKTSELDFETGKVAEEDFEAVKAGAAAEAIEVMRRLDAVRDRFRFQSQIERDLEMLGRSRSVSPERDAQRPTDEAAIWLPNDVDLATAEESSAAKARRRLHRQEAPKAASRRCEACGMALAEDDKFCTECGKSVESTCTACGVTLHQGAKFCHECGERTAQPREGA